jgi:hypothetical protein
MSARIGLAGNERLVGEIASVLELAAARSFKSFMWRTRTSWSRSRRVVAKAEWTKGEANPRFVVTSLSPGALMRIGVRRIKIAMA